MSSLSVRGLTVSYGRTEAVKGIDLEVAAGQVVCLIGANGAGKTSVMRALSGLLKPRGGRISFDGTDITGWRAHRIAGAGLRQVPEGRQIFAECDHPAVGRHAGAVSALAGAAGAGGRVALGR